MNITTQGFNQFRQFLEEACGIVLGENKQYLVSSRLNSILSKNDCESLDDLINRMRSPGSGSRLKEVVVDAMTTNETLWFRDIHPFNILQERVLPEVAKSSPGGVRIWSAACSSGQEPYSISMLLDEHKRKYPSQMRGSERIVATDISSTILGHAKKGEYDSLAVARGLSQERLNRYFNQTASGTWKIKPEIQARVDFRPINLLGAYSAMGKFDIVFCRNVLIYFSSELKVEILRKIHGVLKPGGYLFLGASESLGQLTDRYEMIHCSPGIIYRAK